MPDRPGSNPLACVFASSQPQLREGPRQGEVHMSSLKDKGNRRWRLASSASVLAAAAATALSATPALAQDAEDEAIVVTGSRIVRQDYVANSPVVTVDETDLQISGAQTVDTLLNQMPQFAPGINQSSNNPSNGGQSNLQLRGLGANRTLVLLDGRRLVPSNSTTTVDVNIIPAQLVQSIEVVTGGASAAYGSDAIGGVLNFKLRDFEGFEVSTQYGVTDRQDGETQMISLALGGEFAEGRGRGMLMASWNSREAIYNAARPFSAISGPSAASPLGSTTFDANNLPTAGAISTAVPGAVRTEQFGFNNDGTLFSYINRNGFVSPGGITFDGGLAPSPIRGPDFQFITGALNYMVLPQNRYNVFTHLEYDLTPSAQVFGEFLYTRYDSAQELAASPAAGSATGFRVPTTNPFIPAELAAVLASRPTPGGTFLLDKRFTALGARHVDELYNVAQLTFGVDGRIGEDWTYDIYSSYGRMDRDTIQMGNVSRGAVQRLLSAADGGASLCTGGFNPFGDNPLSESCRAFIGRTSKNVTVYEQRNAEAIVQGPLFELPAGDLRVAVGASYRQDTFGFIPDGSLSASISAQPTGCVAGTTNPCLTGSDIAGFNPSNPLAGETDVFETFAEVLIPLVRDLPGAEEVNISLGYRDSDYSTVGRVESYKGDVDWTVVDGVRFRGAYQRAVRAPSVGELYAIPTLGFPSIGQATSGGAPAFGGDPCDVRSRWRSTSGSNLQASTNAQVRQLCLSLGVPSAVIDTYTFTNQQVPGIGGGNPDLLEETAYTWNVGFVVQPRIEGMLESLSVSVDYWNIEVEDIIGAISATTARDQCFNRVGFENPSYSPTNQFCALFTRNPANGNVSNYAGNNLNLGTLRTSGVDLQVDWSHEVGPGDLSLSWVASWLEYAGAQPLPQNPFIESTGTISNTTASAAPDWKWTTTVSYEMGPFSVTGRWQYIEEMQNFNVAAQQIPAMSYYDLLGSWRVTENVRLTAGVNNVSDELAPAYASSIQANTDPGTYDVLGRRFFVGLTAHY